jgi:hypothetical protein
VLTADTCNPAFASFYHDHIRKLLMVRNRKRYVAKGNYNLTRLAYIHSLYANARFIIPLRHPVNHIASLIKQDALFNKGLKGNPRARRYLAWVGHFEFGPDKRPIYTGDEALVEEIMRSWRQNNNVRAWALHWNALYRFVADQLASTSICATPVSGYAMKIYAPIPPCTSTAFCIIVAYHPLDSARRDPITSIN